MKLVKIYSNKENFHPIRFNTGFNVILGEPKEKENQAKDTHNLGKSLLIEVIDFLLLKKKNNSSKNPLFNNPRHIFSGYEFFLEIELNSGKYLVIKRGVEQNSKISFAYNQEPLEGFEVNLEWQHENLSFKKAREKLDEYLGLEGPAGWQYRNSISYFLRTQQDFADVFQLAKFSIGKHRKWKPFLFALLGFDPEPVKEKYNLEEKKKELEELIEKVKIELNLGIGDTTGDKIQGIIQIKEEEKKKKEEEKKKLEEKIDNFNFYLQDKEVNRQLVDDIDARISFANTSRYNLSEEKKKLETALKTQVPRIDINKLKLLYEEVEIFFPDHLVKEYKDLDNFHLQVSQERKKYMRERLKEVIAELETIDKELKELDEKKSDLLSVLKDKDSYEKFKYYQKELASLEGDIARQQERLENIGKVGGLKERAKKLADKITGQKEAIEKEVHISNDRYKTIRSRFNNIIETVLNAPAITSISLNTQGNLVFKADIQDKDNLEVTAEGYGTTYRKLLCAAFDLSLLITYKEMKQSFYRFVYHDGVLEGLDDRKKINYLEMARQACQEFDLQYIMTAIDADIPYDATNRKLNFADEEIVLKLHDRDDSGRLFKMSF